MSQPDRISPIVRHHARRSVPGSSPRAQVTGAGTSKRYCIVGALAVGAVLIQAFGHWRWPWLTALQGDDVYKQISGLALVAFIAYQWRFSAIRASGPSRHIFAAVRRHKWLGALLAPTLFYAHAQGFGYAYHQPLSAAFFIIVVSGLGNIEITRIRKPWFHPTWVVVHVGLS